MKRFRFLLFAELSLVLMLSTTVALGAVSCSFKTQRVQCGKLACSKTEKICIRCQEDDDCYPSSMQCVRSTGQCRVRYLCQSFDYTAALTMLGGFITCAIGVISGSGGGGILVPMYAVLMKLPLETAVGLSQLTVCGQSALNVAMASRRKHVDRMWDRPLINYQYLSLLFPLSLLGTLFGILNTVIPDLLRLILLFAVLLFVLYRTIKKTLKQYNEDIRENGQEQVSIITVGRSSQPRMEFAIATEASPTHNITQEQYPIKHLLSYALYFLVLLTFNIIRVRSECGGVVYWLSLFIPAVFLFGGFFFAYRNLCVLHNTCPDAITFKWERKIAFFYPFVGILAGAAGSILGIGGGMILGFILYEINLVPDEVSVTTNVITCFIAFTSAIVALLRGNVPIDFAVTYFIVGFGSTLLGNMVILSYIHKHGLRFLIVFCLAFIVLGSLIATGSYSVFDAIEKSKDSNIMKFGRLCLPKNWYMLY